MLKKMSFLLVIKLFSAAFALFFHYLLAKQLSATQFGLFSLAMSCLLFAVTFAKQGLEQVTVRFMAKNSMRNFAGLYWLILSYVLFSAVIIALLVFLLLHFFSGEILKQPLLFQFAPLVALLTVIQTCLGLNSSVLKGKEFATSSLLFSGFFGFLLLIIFLTIQPVNSAYQAMNYFVYAMGIAMLLSFCVIIVRFKRYLIISKVGYSRCAEENFHDIRNASKHLLIISLSALATQQISVLILAKYISLDLLGNFSLALKLSFILSYPLIVINAITAPKYAKLYQQHQLKKFKLLAKKITKGLIVIATIGVGIIYFSIDTAVSVFDESYWQTAQLVKILIIGQWFNLATGSVVSMLIMSGHEKIHQRNSLIITTINIIALLFFIPLYGIWAAVVITTMIMAIKNTVALFFVNKLIYSQIK